MLACLAALLSQVSLVLLSFSMCRGRAGPEKSASVLQGSRSQGTRWKASCQLVSMLGFFTKCQCFSLICFALHRVGLQHFGEREGLLAALGSCKSGCPSCFAEASEGGVSPRLEVGGSACFALALTGCWSWIEGQRCSEAAVVLAYEAQVSVSVLACLAALLSQVSLVLLSFSMCRGRAGPEKSASVLQGSRSQGTRWKASCQLVSMLGCHCFSLICFALHRVGLQHFGCFRFRQIWLLFVFCRCFRTGCQS